MAIPQEHEELFAEVARRGAAIYEEKLKAVLEPEQNGRAVAIHIDTGEYAVADNWALARKTMRERQPDGMVYSRTIGPPTSADHALAHRMLAGQKR